jgi:hypothetical protein
LRCRSNGWRRRKKKAAIIKARSEDAKKKQESKNEEVQRQLDDVNGKIAEYEVL